LVLFEQPLWILFFGTLWVAIAAVVWVQTRHPRALVALVVAVVAVAAALVVERLVVTPREQVAATLRTIARRLEANDAAGVLELVSPQSEDLRREIQTRMRQLTVKQVSIKPNLKVTLGTQRPATSAEARFNAVATLEDPQQLGGTFTVPRFLVVRFRREDDGWRVRDYESFDPRGEQAGRGMAP
jgi:hypothetical protein